MPYDPYITPLRYVEQLQLEEKLFSYRQTPSRYSLYVQQEAWLGASSEQSNIQDSVYAVYARQWKMKQVCFQVLLIKYLPSQFGVSTNPSLWLVGFMAMRCENERDLGQKEQSSVD